MFFLHLFLALPVSSPHSNCIQIDGKRPRPPPYAHISGRCPHASFCLCQCMYVQVKYVCMHVGVCQCPCMYVCLSVWAPRGRERERKRLRGACVWGRSARCLCGEVARLEKRISAKRRGGARQTCLLPSPPQELLPDAYVHPHIDRHIRPCMFRVCTMFARTWSGSLLGTFASRARRRLGLFSLRLSLRVSPLVSLPLWVFILLFFPFFLSCLSVCPPQF